MEAMADPHDDERGGVGGGRLRLWWAGSEGSPCWRIELSQPPCEADNVVIPVLQRKKLRPRAAT